MTLSTDWMRNLCLCISRVILPSAIFTYSSVVITAQGNPSAAATAIPSEQFAIHGQVTYVEQETNGFSALYRGPNSLSPNSGKETVDATLDVGVRLWPGAEAWINPEIDQGFGLNNTLGVAGFPSGEAYKVGKNQPYLRLPRLFVRETRDLDGDREPIEAGINQIGGDRSTNRWVFTVGKFSVTEIFDTNQYAHDPRGDFLNWAAVETGSFDYAADAWGYTVGVAAEWYQDAWTVRAGLFDLSNVPNSVHLEPGFHEFQVDLELEKRHEILGQARKVMLTAFESRGRMGLLDEAVQIAQATGNPVDIAAVRIDGWVQVVHERRHHDCWDRAGPPYSQATVLVRSWPSAPWLVSEGRMGEGTRIRKSRKREESSSRLKYPAMHQSRIGRRVGELSIIERPSVSMGSLRTMALAA